MECDFSVEAPIAAGEKSEIVPTRAELEFLRRENLDLQAKLAAMQKQIDILSSARLMTKDTQQLGVLPEVHKRVLGERDELKNANANLKLDLENLRSDIAALTKERDALRVAWETVKQERDAALASAPAFTPAKTAPVASAPAAATAPPASSAETTKSGGEHRTMANVFTKGPAALNALRAALDQLQPGENPVSVGAEIAARAAALAEVLAGAAGHPAQRLAAACAALVKDAHSRPWTFEPGVGRSLVQATEVIGALLEPRNFKRAAVAPEARALVVDDDTELLEAVSSALKTAELRTTPCTDPKQALEMLAKENFDLVLMDIGFPSFNGIDTCAQIRQMPEHKATPVLFMTVDNSVENRAQSSLQGGDDFISKPFNVLELVVKAATWSARRQFEIKAA